MSTKGEFDWKAEDWSRKLAQQAEDSKEYRHKLYAKVELTSKSSILDVGCGTGAITKDIALLTKSEVIGIDIDEEKLQEAERYLADVSNVKLMKADVLDLPFEDETFDLVVFNIMLIYVNDQQRAVNEMARVTRKNGIVLATLEPDYAARIDYPESPVAPLILKQMEELGADLYTGRKLKAIFNTTGLKTEAGIDTESEFVFIKDDNKRLEMFRKQFWVFEKLLKKNGWTMEQIEKYNSEESERIKSGLSFHFPVCFYAIGEKTQ